MSQKNNKKKDDYMNGIRICLTAIFFVLFLSFSSTLCFAPSGFPREDQEDQTVRRAVRPNAPLPIDLNLTLLNSGFPGGRIEKICVKKGQKINKGDFLFILECMKMISPIRSPFSEEIGEILVKEGDLISETTSLISFLSESHKIPLSDPKDKQPSRHLQKDSGETSIDIPSKERQNPHLIQLRGVRLRFSKPFFLKGQKRPFPVEKPCGTSYKSYKIRTTLQGQEVCPSNKSDEKNHLLGRLSYTLPTVHTGSIIPSGQIIVIAYVKQALVQLAPLVPTGPLKNITYPLESSKKYKAKGIKHNSKFLSREPNNETYFSTLMGLALICALGILNQFVRSRSRPIYKMTLPLHKKMYVYNLDFTLKKSITNVKGDNINFIDSINKKAA